MQVLEIEPVPTGESESVPCVDIDRTAEVLIGLEVDLIFRGIEITNMPRPGDNGHPPNRPPGDVPGPSHPPTPPPPPPAPNPN